MGVLQPLLRKFSQNNPSSTSHKWPVYAHIPGPIVLLGFGSIGRGVLPLIDRHFTYDRSLFTVIDPSSANKAVADQYGVRFLQVAITEENYVQVLTPLLKGKAQAFCVNVSVDTSSRDLILLCQDLGALYIDTVVEPWPGLYFDKNLPTSERTNYMLRQGIVDIKSGSQGRTTAVSCCGANPGCVSWMVKRALLNIATDLSVEHAKPTTREGWAALMQKLGVKGIHIAERDTQHSTKPKPINTFVNTWSIEGFLSEGAQPAELGWGTHEKWKPEHAHEHAVGSQCAIYLMECGAKTRVRSWTPESEAQYGFLVTHNESISLSDYFTLRDGQGAVAYRPTAHYAYHPCNDTVLSLHELWGRAGTRQEGTHLLDEKEIVDGVDELGVLLYGHAKNAYWYGSHLTIQATRLLAPNQNATGLQVTSAILAGMVWALENPKAGIVEVEEMDFERCLEVQVPYLGEMLGQYTDWTPLEERPGLFPEDLDESDPWQFRNVLVH